MRIRRLKKSTKRVYNSEVLRRLEEQGLTWLVNSIALNIANKYGVSLTRLLGGSMGKGKASKTARLQLESELRASIQYSGNHRFKRAYRETAHDGNDAWQPMTQADVAAVMGYKGHSALSKPEHQIKHEVAA